MFGNPGSRSGRRRDTVGTEFPAGPGIGDRFYRSDRNIEYFYSGVRWLSTHLYTEQMVSVTGASNQPFTALHNHYAPNPWAGVYDIYLETFIVNSYNTTVTATNYFTLVLTGPGTSISMQGNTINTHTNQRANINAIKPSTEPFIELTATETGTCSAHILPAVAYRLIG